MKFGSLFSGIGGFDLGFEQAGFECAWQVENNNDCNRVLGRWYPDVARYSDVREIGELPAVDVICGGFPCQDLSVAGKRKGLAGERSGLWFEFLRIVGLNRPRFVVIENVPGLLSGCGCAFCRQVGRNLRVHSIWRSRYFDRTGVQYNAPCAACDAGQRLLESHRGRNFQIVLSGLVELGYCVASRILDAQFYGVAQRRRRVFIVGSLGDGSSAEILFESEGVSWNPPTRREAGARVAPSVACGPPFSRTGNERVEVDALIRVPTISPALTSRDRKSTREDIAEPAFIVTHSLRSEGADASEDGTGRGTPLVVANCFNGYTGGADDNDAQANHLIAFSSKDHGADAGEISPTLRSLNFDKSHINGGGQVAIAFAQNTRDELRVQGDGQISGALSNQPGMKQQTYVALQDAVAFQSRIARNGHGRPSEISHALSAAAGEGDSQPLTAGSFGVRRLTPTECERLQGFPDGWTARDAEGKVISDSARYRMLGNAVAVPVAQWIGRRILEVA